MGSTKNGMLIKSLTYLTQKLQISIKMLTRQGCILSLAIFNKAFLNDLIGVKENEIPNNNFKYADDTNINI